MRSKPLILCLVLLVVLGGVYAALVLGGEEPVDEDEIYAQTGMSSDAMALTEIDMMTIMHFRCETAEGETIELNYTVEGWQVPDNPDYPIDDSLVEDVIQPLCAVKSDRLLTEDPSAMAEYGLSPARFHVELTDSSGNVYAYNIGDKHSTTQKYYFNIEGEDKIYTVPTGVGMELEDHLTLASYMKLPSFPAASASTTESIVVETAGKRVEIVRRPEGDESCYTSDYIWFLKQADGSLLPLSEEELSYFTNALAGMGMLNGVDYSQDPAVLETYGLVEDRQHKISITYESASRGVVTDVFYIGQGTDGKAYARVEGDWVIGSIVNRFDFFDFDYERYKADDFFKMQLDTVDQMTILLEENRYVIRADRTTATGDDGAEKTTTEYTWNGTTLSADAVTAFFNQMRNTVHEGTASAAPGGTPYLEIIFDRNTDAYSQMTLRLWAYDSSFYISEFNGETRLINKMDVKAIVDSLQAALQSQA